MCECVNRKKVTFLRICSAKSSHRDAPNSVRVNIWIFFHSSRSKGSSGQKRTKTRRKRMINGNNNNYNKKNRNDKQTEHTQVVNIPWAGEKTFKYKQSSDWFCKNGNNRFRYSNRPFGIFSSAPVSFWMFGNRCGHTGLNLSAIRIPFHGDGARVGLNLKWEKRQRVGISKLIFFSFVKLELKQIVKCTLSSQSEGNCDNSQCNVYPVYFLMFSCCCCFTFACRAGNLAKRKYGLF